MINKNQKGIPRRPCSLHLKIGLSSDMRQPSYLQIKIYDHLQIIYSLKRYSCGEMNSAYWLD